MIGNVGRASNFTASDTVDITDQKFFNMFSVGTSGDVVLVYADGNTHTVTAAPTGIWIPCGNAVRINSTGTTAAAILVV